MKTAVIPEEEDSKPPARRPRRKAALKSEELIAGMTEVDDPDDVKKPPAKKPRRKKGALKSEEPTKDDDGSPPVVINVDAMVNVMEFLPPRSLYNVALTCKSLREMVTTKMVVQCALIHGGHAKKTMEELYNMMSTHSIHVPSPLRLLRLANGKRCEFCNNKSVNSLYSGLNIAAFSCWDCLAKGDDPVTRAWKTTWSRYWRNPVYRAIFDHPRVAFRDKSKGKFLWIKDRLDAKGNKFGPIVRWKDIDDMANSSDGRNATAAAKTAGYPLRTTAVDALTNPEWIDRYLTDTLGAPPKEDYSEFIEAYTNITERARRVAKEKAEIKRDKRAKQEEKRKSTTDKFVADLTSLIDEPLREKVMEKSSSSVYRTFVTPLVEDLTSPYLRAVSSIKKNTPAELAKQINALLQGLDKLFAMDFLSDDDAFEGAVKALFLETFPNKEALFKKRRSYLNVNFIDSEFAGFVKTGHFFKALIVLRDFDLSSTILATEPSASLAKSCNFLTDFNLKKFAQRAWKKHFEDLKETEDSPDSTTTHAQAFQETHSFFGQVMTKLDEYSTWLEAKRAAKTEDELSVWQREDKVESMLQDVVNGYDEVAFDYFLDNSFELMFKYQTADYLSRRSIRTLYWKAKED